jgi:hypothetical protein
VRNQPGLPEGSPPQELIVTIRRSGNHEADVEQLRLLHELLTEFKGTHSFKFHLIGGSQNNGSLELAFPNDRTRYCPELEQELVTMLGPDCYELR